MCDTHKWYKSPRDTAGQTDFFQGYSCVLRENILSYLLYIMKEMKNMNEYVISCESPVDLTEARLFDRDIHYIPFHAFLDGKEVKDDLGTTFDYRAFYKAISEGVMTKTSQINSDEYRTYFEGFLKEGKDVIHAIEAHHGDVEPQTLIACIVQAADTISAAVAVRRSDRHDKFRAYRPHPSGGGIPRQKDISRRFSLRLRGLRTFNNSCRRQTRRRHERRGARGLA